METLEGGVSVAKKQGHRNMFTLECKNDFFFPSYAIGVCMWKQISKYDRTEYLKKAEIKIL